MHRLPTGAKVHQQKCFEWPICVTASDLQSHLCLDGVSNVLGGGSKLHARRAHSCLEHLPACLLTAKVAHPCIDCACMPVYCAGPGGHPRASRVSTGCAYRCTSNCSGGCSPSPQGWAPGRTTTANSSCKAKACARLVVCAAVHVPATDLQACVLRSTCACALRSSSVCAPRSTCACKLHSTCACALRSTCACALRSSCACACCRSAAELCCSTCVHVPMPWMNECLSLHLKRQIWLHWLHARTDLGSLTGRGRNYHMLCSHSHCSSSSNFGWQVWP